MRLYSYWRSTTSYRVRIALHLKGVPFEIQSIDLVKGEQRKTSYSKLNPIMGVPSLELDDGTILTQSMAILRYLNTIGNSNKFWPDNSIDAAMVEAAALVIATDIHPVNNLKVGQQLKSLGHSQEDVINWMNRWMREGFEAFQAMLHKDSTFCFGEKPGLADICLVPQLYNAHRWGTDLTGLERLTDIEKCCLALPEFDKARPENQPDAQ